MGFAKRMQRIYPIFVALAAQLLALIVLVIVVHAGGWILDLRLPLLVLLLLQALFAASLSTLFRQAPWWLYIQTLLPFMLFAGHLISPPIWIYPVLLASIAAVFWNSADDRVPLYLSNTVTGDFLADLLPPDRSSRFLDLGCGPAGLLIQLAKMRPDCQFTGVETSPALWLLAWLRAKTSGTPNLTILRKNLWTTDFGHEDVVYAFLSPEPMPRLFEKASQQMKTGSLLISNSFSVPDRPPHQIIEVPDRRGTRLLLWRF